MGKICENFLNKKIKEEQKFFTDEAKNDIDLNFKWFNQIIFRNQKKLKFGNEVVYKLVNKPEKNLKEPLLFLGRVQYNGLSDLLLQEGTMKELHMSIPYIFITII